MEIQHGLGGRGGSAGAKVSRPRAAQAYRQDEVARRGTVPLAAPVPVVSQPLPMSPGGLVTPRARPAGLAAVEGYGAARRHLGK